MFCNSKLNSTIYYGGTQRETQCSPRLLKLTTKVLFAFSTKDKVGMLVTIFCSQSFVVSINILMLFDGITNKKYVLLFTRIVFCQDISSNQLMLYLIPS